MRRKENCTGSGPWWTNTLSPGWRHWHIQICKDHTSPVIDAWKVSEPVLVHESKNPEATGHNVVARWGEDAWKAVPDAVSQKAILSAGFTDNHKYWHICRHDVYATLFLEQWLARDQDIESIDVLLYEHIDDFEELVVDDDAE